MGLLRTIKGTQPPQHGKLVNIQNQVMGVLSHTGFYCVKDNCWKWSNGSPIEKHLLRHLEWMEPLEPSPDIQKRAEELWPEISELYCYGRYERGQINNEKFKNRAKALQLATEAVAAEREKYEKEIMEMREAFERILYGAEPANEREYQSWVSTAKNIANEQLQQRIKQLENGK